MDKEESRKIVPGMIIYSDKFCKILKIVRGWKNESDPGQLLGVDALLIGWVDPPNMKRITISPKEVLNYDIYSNFDDVENRKLRERILAYEARNIKFLLHEVMNVPAGQFQHLI